MTILDILFCEVPSGYNSQYFLQYFMNSIDEPHCNISFAWKIYEPTVPFSYPSHRI